MPTIHYDKTTSREYNHVIIKSNGWVKAYDEHHKEYDDQGLPAGEEYTHLRHFPPGEIIEVKGEVTYESPHGRV